MASKKIVVRQVWAANLFEEFSIIRSILGNYPIVSMDTEFPGVIYHAHNHKLLSPSQNYQLMKANVDALNIIQLGLTLSDSNGNLPDLGTSSCFIWEFNFRDFDIDHHPYNAGSINLLQQQGIDFVKNKQEGIHSLDFACFFLQSGLVSNSSLVAWVTFHGAYDIGFLIKILTNRRLPQNLDGFMRLMVFFFGVWVYDMKHMIRFCDGLYGGLEKVAKKLSVERVAGKSHQAGSDSLLTLQTFFKLIDNNDTTNPKSMIMFKGILYGLEPRTFSTLFCSKLYCNMTS